MPTAEELIKAETMPLEELRALALNEANSIVEVKPVVKAVEKKRDAAGKFIAEEEVIDNSGDVEEEVVEEEEEETTHIYRKEITNEDGSVDVYEAESLEELVDKLAEGKRQAVKQLKTIIAEKKVLEAKTQQTTQDEEFLVQQKLKDNPKKTIAEVVNEVIEGRLSLAQRSEQAQSQFVTTHPDYIATPDNGKRLTAEVQRLGFAEFTVEGLEKAYQSLKKSGLLKLKEQEADEATEAARLEAERTAQAQRDATQQRSPKKSSTITRTRSAVVTNTGFNEDEAYKMPKEKLLELANKQLAASRE
jgi:hypothetical protein